MSVAQRGTSVSISAALYLSVHMLTGLGGDESLYALMTNTFDASHVRCSSSMTEPGIEASCRQIVDTMPAGDEDETWFGPAGPGVDVVLPKTFISSK